jgi:glutaredoxin
MITIYSTPLCPHCKHAKQFLQSLNIEFTEVDLSADSALQEKLIQQTGNMSVPMIFVNDEFIGGYDELMNLYATGELQKKPG